MESVDLGQIGGVAVPRPGGTAIPFVRASAFEPFVSFLNSIGAPVDRLLGEARVPSIVTGDPEALVPVMSAYRFIELAAQRERIENLGVLVAQAVTAFDLGAYGAALRSVPTVYEYLLNGVRLIGAHSSGTRLWLKPEDAALRVTQHLVGPSRPGRCMADLYTLVLTITTLRQFLGPTWSPDEIRLLAGNEVLLGEPEVFGSARLITGQRYSSFTISRALLATPAPPWLHAMASRGETQTATGLQMPADFRTSAEQLISSLLVDGYPNVDVAAEAAGMSKRTLQRRLAEAGVSYSGLVSATRVRLAKSWLAESDTPVSEIASMLGYNAASNFVRAFRRETGVSPGSYRHGQMGN